VQSIDAACAGGDEITAKPVAKKLVNNPKTVNFEKLKVILVFINFIS
jgi:hypothetical protein